MAERIKSEHATEQDQYVELYEEIERLPEKYRTPIVLCYLQGHTQEQASQRLGWPLGTVQTRLHRGREQLRSRLTRRGVGPGGLVTTVLALPRKSATAASAAVQPGWASATARAAVRFAAGKTTADLVPPFVVTLAEGALVMMLRDTLKAFALGIVVVGLVSTGVALAFRAATSGPEQLGPPAAPIAVLAQPALPRVQPLRVTPPARKRPDVEQAIQAGARYLKEQQQRDGSWRDVDPEARTGTTSLVTLALLGAGEPTDSPVIIRALGFLRGFAPHQLRSVYAVSLQTRVFAAVGREQDRLRIGRTVEWLEGAQIKPGDKVNWPGSWTYSDSKPRPGDNSNTFFALLGLHAAAEAGVPVKAEVWTLANHHWSNSQRPDGGWGYTPAAGIATASMTCEAIASLILTRTRRADGQESPDGAGIRACGSFGNTGLRNGMAWLTQHFHIESNFGNGQQWKFYYLDALERVGAFSGERLFGEHDWFREGAEELIRTQSKDTGEWRGALNEREPTIATSFALMFLCRGRAPVLIQKARHAPGDDWMNDPDDVRNLVGVVARDWKLALNWQVVDLDSATVNDLLLAPILFLNGHQSPVIGDRGKKALFAYVEQGGFVFAEACCGKKDFDQGFRAILEEVFPDSQLHPLAADHPVWTARHALKPDEHALWGLERAGKTVLIYSPADLSCRWNLRDRYPDEPATVAAIKVGRNVVNYARGR